MIIAGILIALGATANLMLGGIAGAIFFSFGLLTICALEAKLYTGKIAYYFNYSVEEIIFMLIINCLSAGVMASLLLNTRIGPTLVEKAMPIVESKMGESYLSAFIMALMCGAIIYFAIELFKTKAYYGLILAGLGTLFIGMDMMGNAMVPLQSSETFISLMTRFSNPVLGIMAGMIFTAIIQSSCSDKSRTFYSQYLCSS